MNFRSKPLPIRPLASFTLASVLTGCGGGGASVPVPTVAQALSLVGPAIAGSQASFSVGCTGTAGGAWNYVWDFGDSSTQTTSTGSTTHQYANAGTYNVRVNCDDGSGTPVSSTLAATVYPQMALSSTATTVTEGDTGTTITVSGGAPSDTPLTWSIDPSVGTLSSTSNTGSTYTPPNIGTMLSDTTVTITASTPSGKTASLKMDVARKRNYLALVAGGGSPGHTDGVGAAASFNYPGGIAIDVKRRYLYVGETRNHLIRRIDLATATVTTLAGSFGSGAVDGVGSAAKFNAPSGLSVDSSGNIFVADALNCAIRKVTPDGTVSTFAGQMGACADLDGTGTAARFGEVFGLAIDSSDTLYVADVTNNAVRKITHDAVVTTVPITLTAPLAIGVTGAGDQIVTTSGNLMGYGQVLSLFSGTGGAPIASLSTLNTGTGILLDPSGKTAWVAELGGAVITAVTLPGLATTTVVGTRSSPGFTAGPLPGTIGQPAGIARDSNGDLYFTDIANSSVLKAVLP